jgi:hypothetical protein
MVFPVIDISQTNMTSTSNATLNYMKLGVLTRHQLRNLLQDEEESLQWIPNPIHAERRLFHSYNMKSWRNVYTRRQWRLHIDNLYEAMLADQVYQDTLDIAEYEAVHALMHGR